MNTRGQGLLGALLATVLISLGALQLCTLMSTLSIGQARVQRSANWNSLQNNINNILRNPSSCGTTVMQLTSYTSTPQSLSILLSNGATLVNNGANLGYQLTNTTISAVAVGGLTPITITQAASSTSTPTPTPTPTGSGSSSSSSGSNSSNSSSSSSNNSSPCQNDKDNQGNGNSQSTPTPTATATSASATSTTSTTTSTTTTTTTVTDYIQQVQINVSAMYVPNTQPFAQVYYVNVLLSSTGAVLGCQP